MRGVASGSTRRLRRRGGLARRGPHGAPTSPLAKRVPRSAERLGGTRKLSPEREEHSQKDREDQEGCGDGSERRRRPWRSDVTLKFTNRPTEAADSFM